MENLSKWLYNRKLIRLFVPLKYYKLINIDLSRQTNMSIPQKIYFIEKLSYGARMYHWQASKTILNVFLDLLNIRE